MTIDENLLEIRDYQGAGYRPLIDFGAWRVAILRHEPQDLPENITRFERHDETDEVFVLLHGHCTLFLGSGADTITHIQAQPMQPGQLYNVKRGVWHNSTLSPDASVLIVENVNTSQANSRYIPLDSTQKAALINLAKAQPD